jgi:hypothetical protein
VRVPVALGAAERARSAFVAAPPLVPPKTESARMGPALSGVARPEMHSTALAAATPNSALANPNAEVALANAVRACMAERPRAENVTVVVSTTLHLELADDGTVRTARFDPPVAPDVNGCAAQSIYKTRFAHGGSVALPIALTVPE